MQKICWSPRTPLGELTALRGAFAAHLPKNPTYSIVIVLVLCVCTHVYENALLYFLLNVKHGASQLYLGGGSNYLAPALSHGVTCHSTQVNTLRPNPSQTGRYYIYLPRMDGRLSLPTRWLRSKMV